jgi:Flp pilus assembly protein TadB
MNKFQRQLPDALDLLARSLKAGHAFTSGLKMVSEEFEDPAGREFGRTFDEINFGVSTADALKNLAGRIDCPDLSFFAVSVIIQRETGGNLAEILEYRTPDTGTLQAAGQSKSADSRRKNVRHHFVSSAIYCRIYNFAG